MFLQRFLSFFTLDSPVKKQTRKYFLQKLFYFIKWLIISFIFGFVLLSLTISIIFIDFLAYIHDHKCHFNKNLTFFYSNLSAIVWGYFFCILIGGKNFWKIEKIEKFNFQ